MFTEKQKKISLILIFLLSFALRIYNLNKFDLWFDELGSSSFTAEIIRSESKINKTSMLSTFSKKLKQDPQPPLYYSIIFIYSYLFPSLISLRFISVIFSFFSLIIFYKLSRKFFDLKTSIFALLILSLNPFHIWYAQEARGYTVANSLTLLFVYCFIKIFKEKSLKSWSLLLFSGLLAFLSSYHFLFLLIPLSFSIFFYFDKKNTIRWVISLFTLLVVILFIKTNFHDQLAFVKNNFWLMPPSQKFVLYTWRVFSLGYSATLIQYRICTTIFTFLFCYGVWSYSKENLKNTFFLTSLLFAPIIAIFYFSIYFFPIYVNRQLLIFSPFYYLFIAKGISSIKGKKAGLLSLIIVLSILFSGLFNYYRNYIHENGKFSYLMGGIIPKNNNSEIINFLDENYKDGDLILTADLQSYIIMKTFLLKKNSAGIKIPYDRFYYLFFPNKLLSFDVGYLNIIQQFEKVDKKDAEIIYGYKPLEKDIIIEQINFDDFYAKRAWLVSCSWDNKKSLPNNGGSIKYLAHTKLNNSISKEGDSIYLSLFE